MSNIARQMVGREKTAPAAALTAVEGIPALVVLKYVSLEGQALVRRSKPARDSE